MNVLALPWVDIAVILPLMGALIAAFIRDVNRGWRLACGTTVATLVASCMAWAALDTGVGESVSTIAWTFRVDRLSAPMLPLVALLHVLVILATSKVKMNRMSFMGHLIGESIRLATFACPGGWPLVLLLILGTLPPIWELAKRQRPLRVYCLHMAVFAVLLSVGWAGTESGTEWAPAIVLVALLIRCGNVPGHLWVADLTHSATFGTAVLFIAPVTGAYAVLRLVLPVAPEWALQGIGIASLVTALYTAGVATVQTDARRFFSYLALSHSSLVLVGLVELVGLEPKSAAISLTGALFLWVSAALSLTGLGITLRAIESRIGRLDLTQFRGLYDQSPSLAVCFLLTGLAAVGFPGTMGFLAAEVLIDGAVETNLAVGLTLVMVSALNGIAVVRTYLYLFTGARHTTAIPLGITPRERFAVLVLAVLILGGGLIPQPGMKNRHTAAMDVLNHRQLIVAGEESGPSH